MDSFRYDRMPRLLAGFFFTILTAIGTWAAPARAQEKLSNVADWIDDNTALVVHVENLDEAVAYLRELPVYSHPRFQKAVHLLTAEPLSVFHEDRWDEIEKLASQLCDLTTQIDEAAFIIHELRIDSAKLTILLKAEQATLDDFEAISSKLVNHLQLADQPIENDPNETVPSSVSEKDDEFLVGLKGFSHTRIGNWLVASNAPEVSNELCRRLRGDTSSKFRSLADSRKYQTAVARLNQFSRSKAMITVYGNPNRLRVFFPTYDDKTWKAMRVNEMPAFGGHIQFISSDGIRTIDEPIVLVDGILLFTLPASGIGKAFETFRPIKDLPPFAFPLGELDARACDEVALYAAVKEYYDSLHGDGSLDELYSKYYEESPKNFYQDTLAKRSQVFRVQHGNPEVLPRSKMVMERIADREAMHAYVADLNRRINTFMSKERIEEFRDGEATIWRRSDESALRQYLSSFKPGSPEHKKALDGAATDPSSIPNDASAIIGDWYVVGDWPDVKAQIESFREDTGAHRAQLSNMIENLRRATGSEKEPCIIQLTQNVHWLVSISQLERAYLNKHYSREQLAKMEPSEDGFYLQPTSRQENAIVCGLLLATAFVETYGRQLLLFSNDDGALRFSAAVYPSDRMLNQNLED